MKTWAYIVIVAICGALLGSFAVSWFLLRPLKSDGVKKTFEIAKGDGFLRISKRLEEEGIIRSSFGFQVYGVLAAHARHLKPGIYELSNSSSTPAILKQLVLGIDREASVTIPEGVSLFEIDDILSGAGVMPKGEFRRLALKEGKEGYFFPDTYRFYLGSSGEQVLARFHENFERKMRPLLPDDPEEAEETIILASILEKEVPTKEDQRVVAGILLKRMDSGVAMQVDASVCYAKRLSSEGRDCYPVTVLDTQKESPYNTYRNRGLPPGPIGNPGTSAVLAALSPIKSPYWYYLSDPVTKKTIFSKTLEEHEDNRFRYLLSTH